MPNNIKTCPCCSSSDLWGPHPQSIGDYGEAYWSIACNKCGISLNYGDFNEFDSKASDKAYEELIRRWNLRTGIA